MFLLKAVVSLGSLYFVSRTIAWDEVVNVLKGVQITFLIIALVIFWVAQVFSSLRCAYIARVLGGQLDLLTSLRAHFVGLWFNQVLPTGLGGDVVKMAILKKSLGLSIAIRSAILDRLSGFVFLLLAVAVTLPLYTKLLPSHPELVSALGMVALGGCISISLGAWLAQRWLKLIADNAVLQKIIQLFCDVWQFRKGIVDPIFKTIV